MPFVVVFSFVAALSSCVRQQNNKHNEKRKEPRGRGVIIMGLNADERLMAVGLGTGRKVLLQGTNRSGRSVVVVLEGAALARHVLRRARKGSLLEQRIKPTGFAREA